MKEILKPVTSIEDLVVNHDGTLIYYKGRIKNILIDKPEDRIVRKIINLTVNSRNRTLTVSRLVYEAWVAPLPKYRKISYLDENGMNTHYKNLLPRPISESLCKEFKPVDGLNNVLINSNGTEIYQDGVNVNITFMKGATRKASAICVLHTWNGARYFYVAHLVANAWLNWSGRGYVLHLDSQVTNNHYKNLKPVTIKEYKHFLSQNAKLPAIRRATAIPKKYHQDVKKMLLSGTSLALIASDFCCSDMAVHRLKVKLLTKQEIKELHKRQGISTEKTPKEVVKEIIRELKENKKKQVEIAKKYNVGPTIVCRIARQNKIKCNPIKRISIKTKQNIKKDFEKLSIKDIAAKYNVSESSVYKYSR